MIKSFKDFDNELKSQKIYEAIDDDIREENGDVFTEEDVVIPDMVSDNKFLLNIPYKTPFNPAYSEASKAAFIIQVYFLLPVR